MMVRRFLGVAAVLAIGLGGVAAAAPARADAQGYCVDGDGGNCLFYSANETGAADPIYTASVPCYDGTDSKNDCGRYSFWDSSAGSAGYNQPVRNATHSVVNNNVYYALNVFVYPDYSGPTDAVECDTHYVSYPPNYENLGVTRNNNASQNYIQVCF
jgi:hypothetical protein